MKHKGLTMNVVFAVFLLLGALAVVLNAYSVQVARSILTPLDTHFDTSLPGRTIAENGLNADFFCKASDRPQKAVMIPGDSEGEKHWSTNTPYIQQLLDEGYCVMVLAYFHARGLPDYLREIPLEYFEKAFHWLAAHKQVVPDHYAVIGHSRGGELALLLASRYSQVKAGVALSPSSVVFPGSPLGLFDVLAGQHSAWSYQDQPLPFVPWPISLTNAPGLVSLHQTQMFEQALQNKGAVELASIEVENISGPVLCFSAGQDEPRPSTLICDQVMDRHEQKGFPFHHEHFLMSIAMAGVGLRRVGQRSWIFSESTFR